MTSNLNSPERLRKRFQTMQLVDDHRVGSETFEMAIGTMIVVDEMKSTMVCLGALGYSNHLSVNEVTYSSIDKKYHLTTRSVFKLDPAEMVKLWVEGEIKIDYNDFYLPVILTQGRYFGQPSIYIRLLPKMWGE